LLKSILTHSAIGYLLVIATYRTDEYRNNIHLVEFLHEVNTGLFPTQEITLADLDEAATRRHVAAIAARARELNLGTVWIDMEGSDYTEVSVALYEGLRPDNPNLGICLQAYLRRTAADITRLLPLEPAVRMVKGAYDEPALIAYRSKSEVDANFVAQCIVLLRDGTGLVGLGTHDVRLIEQIASAAEAAGIGRERFEVEMLYGIRADELERLARAGYQCRVLIAYGEFWYPWYLRRLAERPANVTFVLRQLLPW
jgi:proline dehydrogenase